MAVATAIVNPAAASEDDRVNPLAVGQLPAVRLPVRRYGRQVSSLRAEERPSSKMNSESPMTGTSRHEVSGSVVASCTGGMVTDIRVPAIEHNTRDPLLPRGEIREALVAYVTGAAAARSRLAQIGR